MEKQRVIRPNQIVIVLRGRYAGRKAIILRTFDTGSKSRKYSNAILAGIDRYPLRVTKGMSKKKIARKTRIKPFVKTINYEHIMPTRYEIESINTKSYKVNHELLRDVTKKSALRRKIRTDFMNDHKKGGNEWFYTKLRF